MSETQDHELELVEPAPQLDSARLTWHPSVVGDPPSRATSVKKSWAVDHVGFGLAEKIPEAQILQLTGLQSFTDVMTTADLDVSWDGHSAVIVVHAYMPRIALESRIWDNGLDFGMQARYETEQLRSGRPFYVVWAWWATDWLHPRVMSGPGRSLLGPGSRILGKRIDQLGRPHETSPGKSYWPLSELWTLDKIIADFTSWRGPNIQESLL